MTDELHKLINMFEEAEMNSRDSRKLALKDRDYYDGIQWTDEEIQTLKKRGQPAITINRIKPKIDFMLGLETTSRNDPKAMSRTPLHEADAGAVTDILRYIETSSEFDDVRTHGFKNFAIEGTAAVKIEVKALKDAKDNIKDFHIEIKPLEWDRIFWDAHSRLANFKDARYKGEVAFMDIDAAKDMFPGKDLIIDGAVNSLGPHKDTALDLFQDRPNILWTDKNRKRVKVVEMWYKKGQETYYAIFTKGGFLVDPKRTPYKNDMGLDEDPYVFRSAFVDRNGGRYGHVRQLIDIQDEINKRRSKALHMMSVRQTRVSRATELDTKKLRTELARPDGIIRAETDEFEVLPTNDMAAAQFSLLQDAQTQIDLVGTNAALQGKQQGEASGKALQARSASGAVEVSPLFDGIRMWQREVFKKAWNRVREYWTEEKYIRVTDNPETTRFVLLNRDETKVDMFEDPDPSVTVVNTPIPEMDVDIVVTEGPNDLLVQQEQFIELTRMAASGVQIPVDAIIELSAIRPALKEKILQSMKPDPQAAAAQAQIEQQNAALDLAQKAADVDDTRANAEKKRAEAGNKQLDSIIKSVKPIDDL